MEKQTLFQRFPDTYPVIRANQLDERMRSDVEPFLREKMQPVELRGKDGQRIFCAVFRAERPKGTIHISHGFSEGWEKYREMIWYFLRENYNVCIQDHRGHGRSRMTSPGGPTHVDHFEDYVDDFETVSTQVVEKLEKPWAIYAHSMGGLIAALFLQRNPERYDRAILNAPMFEINRGGIPYPVAKAVASVLCFIGQGKKYLLKPSPYNPQEDFEGSASSCKERYLQYYHLQRETPELQNGGPSCRWTLESFRAGERLFRKGACAKMDLPILLFQAESDAFTAPGGQDRFISEVPNGELVFVPKAKHEIYLSGDEEMAHYVSGVMDFLR